MLEVVSIYFSGGFIDYQFYINLNINDIIEGISIFPFQFILSIVVYSILVYFFQRLMIWIKNQLNRRFRSILFVLSIISISFPQGPMANLYEIYQVTTAPKMNLTDALAKLDMNNYPKKADIRATKGKNIIVLSLESFEQGMIHNQAITPNLNKMKDRYHFYPNMEMAKGSSWTTASMYTYMTGMPFLVGGASTTPFASSTLTQLVTLPDVLHAAGYNTEYIIGQPTFAGIGHILSMFDIDIISEQNYPNQYPTAQFGLYDKDTLDIAKKQITQLRKKNQPFALFISTISTHAPAGFKDERMNGIIDSNLSSMDFAAASLDYNLADFIHYLEESGQLNDTVFYIFPDHLMMGAGTKTIAKLNQEKRELYVITNAPLESMPYQPENNIYQIDLPRIILDGAGIKSNATFLTDYLSKKMDKKSFIAANKTNIATINRSAKQDSD